MHSLQELSDCQVLQRRLRIRRRNREMGRVSTPLEKLDHSDSHGKVKLAAPVRRALDMRYRIPTRDLWLHMARWFHVFSIQLVQLFHKLKNIVKLGGVLLRFFLGQLQSAQHRYFLHLFFGNRQFSSPPQTINLAS